MADQPIHRRSRFTADSFRLMHEAKEDSGHPFFQPGRDLPMLLAFLERFNQLGWFPPIDAEKRRLLAAHDVIMHVIRDDLCFYEFCSKGARGERDPWLSIFFHVDMDSTIRVCALQPTGRLGR